MGTIVILQSKQWSRYNRLSNPLLKHLRNGRKQSDACLRRPDAVLRGIGMVDEQGNEKKHL